jgi:hypothetical protein
MDQGRELERKPRHQFWTTVPSRFAPPHDRYWDVGAGCRILVPAEEQFATRNHDSRMRDYFREVARDIRSRRARILWVRGELQLKRAMGKDKAEYHMAYGEYPTGQQLVDLARKHGLRVSEDGIVQYPDFQIGYRDRGGNATVENHDWVSGRGRRIAQKIALGYKIGGISRRPILFKDVGKTGRRLLRDRNIER